jgi:hypothetical protein
MSPGARFVSTFLATCVTILAVAAAFNLLVDPYDINHLIRSERFNGRKPAQSAHARLHKPFELWGKNYDGVVLGTSQVEQGFDTIHPALIERGATLYNAGISEERPFEQALLLRHAAETAGVKFAIVALDFLRYVDGGGRPKFMRTDWTRWHAVEEYLTSLISGDTLRDSYSTIVASWKQTPTLQHLPNGTLNIEPFFTAIGQPDYDSLFDSVDAAYLNGAYEPLLARRAELTRRGFDHSALKEMLATARQFGVQLSIFIPPSHARQAEVIRFLGLQPLFDQWLRELVKVLAEEANQHRGGETFKIWDFSGYNSVTTEALPPSESKVRMLWYQDSVHFTYRTGRAILDTILAFKEPELFDAAKFGVELTPTNMDEHLRRRDRNRSHYVAVHSGVEEKIARLFRGAIQH